MNAKQFKQLIKECVREAVREELVELFSQPKKKMVKENLSYSTDDINNFRGTLAQKMQSDFGLPNKQKSDYQLKTAPLPKQVVEDNPLAAFIADAAANMTAEDLIGIRNLG